MLILPSPPPSPGGASAPFDSMESDWKLDLANLSGPFWFLLSLILAWNSFLFFFNLFFFGLKFLNRISVMPNVTGSGQDVSICELPYRLQFFVCLYFIKSCCKLILTLDQQSIKILKQLKLLWISNYSTVRFLLPLDSQLNWKFLESIQQIYCVFAFIYVDNIMTKQATKRAS